MSDRASSMKQMRTDVSSTSVVEYFSEDEDDEEDDDEDDNIDGKNNRRYIINIEMCLEKSNRYRPIFPKDIRELNSFLILLLDLDLNILYMLLFKRRLSPNYITKFISLEFQLHSEIIAIIIIIKKLWRTVFNLQITRSRATRDI